MIHVLATAQCHRCQREERIPEWIRDPKGGISIYTEVFEGWEWRKDYITPPHSGPGIQLYPPKQSVIYCPRCVREIAKEVSQEA